MDAFHASDQQFLAFISTLVPLDGEGLESWTWEERRDFLNWAIDQEVLVVQGARLLPNPDIEESIPTEELEEEGMEDYAERETEAIS